MEKYFKKLSIFSEIFEKILLFENMEVLVYNIFYMIVWKQKNNSPELIPKWINSGGFFSQKKKQFKWYFVYFVVK